jgi:hypothetical protein
MIGILDQIEIQSANVPALLKLIEEQYLPGALGRGMTRRNSWISPPAALTNAPNTMWVMWEVPDVAAWWNMRFQSGADPSVGRYWAEVDRLCTERQRHYLIDGESAAGFAEPRELGTARLTNAVGVRETTQYSLLKDTSPETVAAWQEALRVLPQKIPGLLKVSVNRNLEGSFHAGDFTYWAEVVLPLERQVVERELAIELQLISGGLRMPDIGRAIKRTAYFRLLPDATGEAIRAWENDLLDMPLHMPGMTNWSLSRSANDDHLYVWEQEYLRLDDLLGEYMMHPHHWSHVDTWFDPEFSRRIVDTDICHAFCESSDNILASGMNPSLGHA